MYGIGSNDPSRDETVSVISMRSSQIQGSGRIEMKLPDWYHIIENEDMDYMKYLFVASTTCTPIQATNLTTFCESTTNCYIYRVEGYTVDLPLKKLIESATKQGRNRLSEFRMDKDTKSLCYHIRKSSYIGAKSDGSVLSKITGTLLPSLTSTVTRDAANGIEHLLITPSKIMNNELIGQHCSALQEPILEMLRGFQRRKIAESMHMMAEVEPVDDYVHLRLFGFSKGVDLLNLQQCQLDKRISPVIHVNPWSCDVKLSIINPSVVSKKCNSIVEGLVAARPLIIKSERERSGIHHTLYPSISSTDRFDHLPEDDSVSVSSRSVASALKVVSRPSTHSVVSGNSSRVHSLSQPSSKKRTREEEGEEWRSNRILQSSTRMCDTSYERIEPQWIPVGNPGVPYRPSAPAWETSERPPLYPHIPNVSTRHPQNVCEHNVVRYQTPLTAEALAHHVGDRKYTDNLDLYRERTKRRKY